MDEGIIVWDAAGGRPDIMYRDGTFFGGLHCGDTLEIFAGGKWRPVRSEYCHETGSWYLTGADTYHEILWLDARN